MEFYFLIPTPNGNFPIEISPGSAAIFVGANGSGKTKLAVFVEKFFKDKAHRISAHRSLSLNPNVTKISENQALEKLHKGGGDFDTVNHIDREKDLVTYRNNLRWKESPETYLLNDYDPMLQALFAQQANICKMAYDILVSGAQKLDHRNMPIKFKQLTEIWERLLPYRQLNITADDISVLSLIDANYEYPASEMSDGERAIFYMIGQVLVACDNQILIIDEPELHMHPSIMSKLWDELESVRPDCTFIYITHDLAFAASRSAQKYVIRNYTSTPTWKIETVPDDTGFSEEIVTLILGSRKPILFVEGTENSLDLPIYRACYPEWTVIPRSSCTEVIHSVVTMRKNKSFTRVTCTGIVDGDDYTKEDRDQLKDLGIQVLPVCQVENLLLLPSVTASILEYEGHVGAETVKKQTTLANAVFATLDEPKKMEKVVLKYCKRRIDRLLKEVGPSNNKTVSQLQYSYISATNDINIIDIATQRTKQIETAIAENDLTKFLEYYNNKGLSAIAAIHLKGSNRDSFESWVIRSLTNETCPSLRKNLSDALPTISSL